MKLLRRLLYRRRPAPVLTGMRRFDTAPPAEIDALPAPVRKAVLDDRKRRVTTDLQRTGGR